MASAFYDLGMKLHRGAVEDRLKNLSQGQSFLAKQRQVRGQVEGNAYNSNLISRLAFFVCDYFLIIFSLIFLSSFFLNSLINLFF